MNTTLKINLAGSLFQIEEDAYRILKDYLLDLNNRFKNTDGGAETIEDIESRIAELLQSRKGSSGIIDRENVEWVISTLGNPSDFDITGDNFESVGPSPSKRALYRNPDDRIIGGVCGGTGAYLNVDAVWIRILFILFAITFGIGFFIYLALWIVLPSALSEHQKSEMYGGRSGTAIMTAMNTRQSAVTAHKTTTGSRYSSAAGNAINEIFVALGKIFFIILRIILILTGVALILAGFSVLVVSVMVLFLKYPAHFSTDEFGLNLFYIPDFLNYIVNPALSPWIIALAFILIALPMIAFIYWGVKMIFWFRAKDGIISLAGFLMWVLCAVALSMILFNEGISFAERGKAVTLETLGKNPENVYIKTAKKAGDLSYDKDISFPDGNYEIYLSSGNKNIYIGTSLLIRNSEDETARIEVVRHSSGRSNAEARKKAEALEYGYSYSSDTLKLDEYFTVPAGNRWAIDKVSVSLFIPEGTVVELDRSVSEILKHEHSCMDEFYDEYTVKRIPGSYIMTEDGLEPVQ
ncbi:MAG: PspC domain-containing protein [Bacteroidales bacterium]|jgi:phage shock protein PspC (stress-responsive transcriptional regulator)|nr:PspC domain-containing protein [Bacteroidales bacterium]